jgi:hypothetical protein
MSTITLAKAKWASKMAKAGPKWKKGVEDAVRRDAWSKAYSLFLEGKPVNPEKIEAYKEGVGRVTAEAFQAAVRGKEEKWAERLIHAMAAA